MARGMRVLVVGSGGREHALVWKIAQSPLVKRIWAAPGSPGIALEKNVELVPIPLDDSEIYIPKIVAFSAQEKIDLAVVGPEAPLVAGLADALEDAGIRVFGPRKRGAMLEGSKSFAKDLMARYGIPTAPYRYFDEWEPAEEYIHKHPLPVVIKFDGLAGGKGSTVARTTEEALQAAERWLKKGRIVVEEFLDGEEVTFTCIVVSASRFEPWPTSQDHKHLLDGDQGPMTGGMGAYSPAPVVDGYLYGRITAEIVFSLLRAFDVEMIPYTGFLYIGLMIVEGKPYVLEFNCRLGDPEAQALLVRFRSDLFSLLYRAAQGEIDSFVFWDERPAVCVVLASHGYPDKPRTGDRIYGILEPDDPDVKVFHASTALDADGHLVTAGGRVFGVTALGKNMHTAKLKSYSAAGKIYWDGQHCRKDICWRALARERV